MEKKLEISHFTDPLCFWCYAMEPEVRKIRMLLGEQLDYRIIMGVLSSDIREIVGYDEESEIRFEIFRAMMSNHLIEAAKSVGMPIASSGLFTHSPEEMISLPLSLAYCAMKMIDETVAEAFLRRMRECVFAEGRSLSDTEELVKLASEFPIDAEQFRANLESDEAGAVLQEGLDMCLAYGVTAFPTLLLSYDGRRALISGYHSFDEFREVIAQFTEGEITMSDAEYSTHALEAYLDCYGKAAAREIQTMFSLDDAQLANAMMDLVSTGCYKTESCGTSYFVMPK